MLADFQIFPKGFTPKYILRQKHFLRQNYFTPKLFYAKIFYAKFFFKYAPII